MSSDEFMKAVADFDCPEKIFKMAESDWERAVAVEFFLTHKRLDTTDNDIKWLKYLVKGVFGVVVITLVSQVVPILLGLLG